ncbi:MAG: hypothetical protein HY898_34430 [Deltaproteobacteria bacterium]|nr:hypothetical protein [Deltaproteobacteria bacterium]
MGQAADGLGRERPAFREHDPDGETVGSLPNERTFWADVRDRRTPIARIVPLSGIDDLPAEEAALASEGKVRLPIKRLTAAFWKAWGPRVANDRLLEILREDRDSR